MLVNTRQVTPKAFMCWVLDGASHLGGKHHQHPLHLWQLRPLVFEATLPLCFSISTGCVPGGCPENVTRSHCESGRKHPRVSQHQWTHTGIHLENRRDWARLSSRLSLPIFFPWALRNWEGLQVTEGLREWCSRVRELTCLFGIIDNTEILKK